MSTITGDNHHLPDEFGFAFIKSGFEHVRDGLERDFRGYGINVVGACPVVLSPIVVEYVYRDSREQPFFTAMHKHLTSLPVIAMALHGIDQNTQATIHDLKCGNNGLPCLRNKYAQAIEPLPDEEIEAWLRGDHPDQDAVTIRLTQNNVMHAADDTGEAVESLRLLGVYNSEFWASTYQDDPRVRILASYLTTCEAATILV